MFTVAEVARAVQGRLLNGREDGTVCRVVVDSRQVGPGDLFIALRGSRTDGHDHVGDAFRRGALAALVEADVEGVGEGAVIRVAGTLPALGRLAAYHRRRLAPTVVAVTGSVGKTTTKDLIASVASAGRTVLKSRANYNTEIGLPLTLLELRDEHQVAVLEMAMRGLGQIRYLAGVAAPDIGVLTVIAETHLELLGSVENIARAKGELLEELPPHGTAVLNRHDPWQEGLSRLTRAETVWYGLGQGSHVTAESVQPLPARGYRFVLAVDIPARSLSFRVPVRLPLPGRHHLLDGLAAAAVGAVLGLEPGQIRAGLEGAVVTGMRWEVLNLGPITVINDAYNASPASVRAALETLAEVGEGRRVVVLGDMLELGERSIPEHEGVGREVARLPVDRLITVGDLSSHITRAAVRAGYPAGHASHCRDKDEAARLLGRTLREGDTVLVKGSRGIRLEELIESLRGLVGDRGSEGSVTLP